MTDNPLFYRSIVPLNRQRHRGLRLKTDGQRFAFAASTHLVPAVVDEFVAASRTLPIVFLPATPHPTPVFLVGLRPGQNQFVDDAGRWAEGYVPAFARRYPFMLGEPEQGAPVVCIDEKYEGLKDGANGESLFAEDGADTPFLQEQVKFVNDYFAAAKRTDAFLRTLSEMQLLRAVTIELKLHPGAGETLHGFLAVDEQKLDGLTDEEFLRLRKEGLLPAIFAHLFSLGATDRLRQLAASRAAA